MTARMHSREEIVRQARTVLRDAVVEWAIAYPDLTEAEFLSVVSDVLGDQIGGLVKLMIRTERHPDDPDKPGGLE